MRTIQKSLITASLLLAQMTTFAQNELLEGLPTMLQREFGVEMKKSINYEGDVHTHMLKSRCEIYVFTLTKKQQEKVFQRLLDSFEVMGRSDKNCYSVNGMNDLTGKESLRNLIIGDDINRYVTIGKDYNNYINVNILDANDTTKTHRYAYALEWRAQSGTSEKGAIDVRYIVTYAKIPSNPSSSLKVIKYKKSNKDAIESYKEFIKGIDPKILHRIGDARIQNRLSLNGDSAFVVEEIEEPAWNTEVLPVMERGNYLLMFSNLKQNYKKQKNSELTAISIYSLCKQAIEEGYFRDDSVEELEQIISEVDKLIEEAKTETDRRYFQMAREQLDKILKSRK